MHRQDISVYYRRPCSVLDVLFGFFKFPGFRAIFLHRVSHRLHTAGFSSAAAIVMRLIRVTCNVDIEPGAKIGTGLRMPHTFAIVIGGGAVIGSNVTIMQCVTIGGNGGKAKEGRTQPVIGNGVFIGPGAKVLGPVVVGDKAKVGANSVVIKDVAPCAVAVGVPAKQIIHE